MTSQAPFELEGLSDGDLPAVESAIAELKQSHFIDRLWSRDGCLWHTEAEELETIVDRLGWLDLPETMADEARALSSFRVVVNEELPECIVLLGMGGSSLAAEVVATFFGISSFRILDSTVPEAVAAFAKAIDPARTLFLVASKSGSTTETMVLTDIFYGGSVPVLADPGGRFFAITDPGTPLQKLARHRGFRRAWLNPPDVGGRFSALSLFGLVPMAAMGVDCEAVLESARRMAVACAPEVPERENPGLRLGAMLYVLSATGRDKVTFLPSGRAAAFGAWVEQLLAESTGKNGKGLVPVTDEPLLEVKCYGSDRAFVLLRFTNDPWPTTIEAATQSLRAAGHPVIEFELQSPEDIGAEFFRWEMAVAVAGSLMNLNPFNEPDVEGAKIRTHRRLAELKSSGRLSEPSPVWSDGALTVYADLNQDTEIQERAAHAKSLEDWLEAHLARLSPPDYLGMQVFLPRTAEAESFLASIRSAVASARGVATTLGWGPRYLHSTGQLHKGGPTSGAFVQIIGGDGDFEIPGRNYGLRDLCRAQAIGDLEALVDRGRRLLRIDLGEAPNVGLERLARATQRAMRR